MSTRRTPETRDSHPAKESSVRVIEVAIEHYYSSLAKDESSEDAAWCDLAFREFPLNDD